MTAVMLFLAGLQSSPSPMSEPHREFLEDVAHYLLTLEQAEQFLELETDASRNRFIERFWKTHDVAEHTERLLACDRLFGARGRWSERGRIHQWLGPPTYREDLSRSGHRLVPSELWHYTGVEAAFLPDAFYLIFFRPGGFGAFRLWNPEGDDIASLVPTWEPNRIGLGADATLEQIDPELALAVESLVPGGGRRESQSLLASLDALPELIERERAFGANVRASASMRELERRLVASVWRDDVGVAELHYALELAPGAVSDASWRADGDARFRLRFRLVGRLVSDGVERERWEDTLELDVSAAEKQALTTTRLVFQGQRLVDDDDDRFELALVTETASALEAMSLPTGSSSSELGDGASRAAAFSFETELNRDSAPARVLERDRTPHEQARYRLARGLALARRGSSERAVEELEASLELDGGDVWVHLELARLLYALRRYAEVLSRLGLVEHRFNDETDLFVLMAGAADALSRDDDAMRYYEKALLLSPSSQPIRDALEQVRRRSQIR